MSCDPNRYILPCENIKIDKAKQRKYLLKKLDLFYKECKAAINDDERIERVAITSEFVGNSTKLNSFINQFEYHSKKLL